MCQIDAIAKWFLTAKLSDSLQNGILVDVA